MGRKFIRARKEDDKTIGWLLTLLLYVLLLLSIVLLLVDNVRTSLMQSASDRPAQKWRIEARRTEDDRVP